MLPDFRWPEPEDDLDRKLLADVVKHKCCIVEIAGDQHFPGYSFSVGLFLNFGHPELIVVGLNPKVAFRAINDVRDMIQAGRRFKPGDLSDKIFERCQAAFVEAPASTHGLFIGTAIWFYRSLQTTFPVLQLVWPDNQNRFPWDPGCDERCGERQPLLGPYPTSRVRGLTSQPQPAQVSASPVSQHPVVKEPLPVLITIMADYDGGYAWDQNGEKIWLHPLFPDLPEVKRIEAELIDWSGQLWKSQAGDPTFPWQDFHNRGLALARQFKEALPAACDIQLSYVRALEDPASGWRRRPTLLRRGMPVLKRVSKHPGLVVLHATLHCQPCGFWLLDMQPNELEDLWRSQETFASPLSPEESLLRRLFFEPLPPVCVPPKLPGVFVTATGRKPVALWNAMSKSERHYRCVICGDDDSILIAPDGRRIRHKGCPDPKPG